ncbi:hypothetical protein JCM8208_004538 [Rhodotorula glutinis]
MPKRARPADGDKPHPPRRLAGGARAIDSDSGNQAAGRTVGTSTAQLRFKGGNNSTRAPPAKRARTTALPLLSLEGSLSEEILLRCLSFLGAHDLVTVSRVSSAWWRLSQDPQLWRSLYLRTYASPSVRRRALAGENVAKTRPWRELYKVSTNWRTGSARTSTLGKGIRKAVLPEAPRDLSIRTAEPPPAVPALSSPLAAASPVEEDADTLLQFHHNFILSASRTPTVGDDIPSVTVHRTLAAGDSAVVGAVTSSRLRAYFAARPDFRPPLSITEMRLDEDTSASASREGQGPLLAVFFSTGQFALFRLALPSPADPSRPFSAHEVYTSLALGAPPVYPFTAAATAPSTPFDPVVFARLHGPLLVTLSREMTMRFWRVGRAGVGEGGEEEEEEEGEEEVQLEEAETPLQTRESWSPVVLSLTRDAPPRRRARGHDYEHDVADDERFTVSLAYSAPVFPAAWTVGLQEFVVVLPRPSSLPVLVRTPKMRITARNATALPAHAALPSTPRRTAPLLASASSSTSPPTAPRNPVTSIEHSHPFIVTSRADNTLDVYEVVAAPLAAPPPQPPRTSRAHLRLPAAPPPLHILHRRTLFGHTARVASVALRPSGAGSSASASAAGGGGPGVRCVSAGDDGAVKVWSLVPTPTPTSTTGKRAREGAVREEGVIDVRAAPVALEREGEGEGGDEAPPTAWQRMKRRRGAGVRAQESSAPQQQEADGAPQRVRRVWVEEDKIVVAERARDGRGEETVRVLRFD